MVCDRVYNRINMVKMEEKIDNIYKRIWELKTRARIADVKTQIQKLQQEIDKGDKGDGKP